MQSRLESCTPAWYHMSSKVCLDFYAVAAGVLQPCGLAASKIIERPHPFEWDRWVVGVLAQHQPMLGCEFLQPCNLQQLIPPLDPLCQLREDFVMPLRI